MTTTTGLDVLIAALDTASDFDLFRVHTAIDRLLYDPRRIVALRQRLHLGQTVAFFDFKNDVIRRGRIVAFKPDQVWVDEEGQPNRWKLPYAGIDPDSLLTLSPGTIPKPPSRPHFGVGDSVGFYDRDGLQRVGVIQRINAKTATLLCDGQHWRVSYALLHRVVDA